MRRTRSGGKPAYALSSSQQETVETQHSVVDGDATHAMRLSSKERWGGISSRYGWECLGRVRRRWLSDIGVFRSTRASRKAPVRSAGIVLEPDDDDSQILPCASSPSAVEIFMHDLPFKSWTKKCKRSRTARRMMKRGCHTPQWKFASIPRGPIVERREAQQTRV